MSRESREYTHDEMKQIFLNHVHDMVDYWEKEERTPDVRGKLEGLAFSILAAIDGSAASLPSYILIPITADGDKEFHESRGENYYPEEAEDLAGSLHDAFCAGRKELDC